MSSHVSGAETPQSQPLLRSATVKSHFGGISDMTLWRWMQHRGFPRPLKLHGRNYWDAEAIERWTVESTL